MLHLLGRQEEALATYDGVIDSCRTIASDAVTLTPLSPADAVAGLVALLP